MWVECDILIITPINDALKIIDDAMSNGFEFKVENHKLYFREIEC